MKQVSKKGRKQASKQSSKKKNDGRKQVSKTAKKAGSRKPDQYTPYLFLSPSPYMHTYMYACIDHSAQQSQCNSFLETLTYSYSHLTLPYLVLS